MKKLAKVLGTTIIVILVMAFCISATAMSKTKIEETELQNYYREKEKEFVKEVRSFLNENGFTDSGITLTRVVDGDERMYTMTIHHGKIDRMTEKERRSLKETLMQQSVPMANSSLEYKFLIATAR